MINIFSYLFVIWLSLLPLVMWNGIYEGAKVLYFFSGGFLVTAFTLIRWWQGKPLTIAGTDKLYFLWLAVLLVSSLVGIHPVDSFIGGNYRHQGVLFFFALWLAGKNIGILTKNLKLLLVKLISVTLLAEGIIVICDYFFKFSNWRLLGYKGPLGTLGEPNAAAGFIALGLFFIITANRSGKFSEIINFLGISVTAVSLYLLNSVSGAVVFSEILAANIFKNYRQKLLLIFIAAVVPVSIFAGIYQKQSIDIGQNIETRQLIWKYSRVAILKRPLLGYGPETTAEVFENLFRQNKIAAVSLTIERSHNLLLDLLIWSGLLGAVAFVFWIFACLLTIVKNKLWLKAICVTAWLTFASVQPISVVHWVMLITVLNI